MANPFVPKLTAMAVSAVLLLMAAPAQAHKLKVFAAAVGPRIEGRAYFVGGGAAVGVRIRVEDPGGREIAAITADGEGRFQFTATARVDHVIVADAGDGHRSRLTLPAGDLPASLPAPAEEIAAAAAEPEPETAPPPRLAVAPAQLQDLVGEAVARQILPLRRQLDAHQDQVRLRDIVGGIGYIVGLAGLALWLAARRVRRSRS
jgi:nickel transport protein